MKITVVDTKTGKARVMERRFAQILSKLGKIRYPEPAKRKPKTEDPAEEPVKTEEPAKEPETKKREYKRRDLKAED